MCMNTIKIFLASSCELAYERMIIGDKIRQADDEWRAKGVRLQLMVWEDYRPEFLGVRTQTEYDEYLVNESQIVIGLFKNRCGKYTQEEIVNAIKASIGDKGKLPVVIYLEKGSLLLNNSQKISNALANFGVFTIEYGTMIGVKTNLLIYRKRAYLYCIRRKSRYSTVGYPL